MGCLLKKKRWAPGFAVVLLVFCLSYTNLSVANEKFSCLKGVDSTDAIIVATHDGRILYRKNEAKKCVPASTLKLLTALVAIHHLGTSYRFQTKFYLDADNNLKIKGYGDPLLISEVWEEIVDTLAKTIHSCNDLVLDDTYFSNKIKIPGLGCSSNPYDAPPNALCANFNTIFFDFDRQGKIVSAEPQTPMIPYAVEKIRFLGLKKGRHTLINNQKETALYAGELLKHFLRERGVDVDGSLSFNAVSPEDKLIFTYQSRFTLLEVLEKMLKFSNNFIANQILLFLGAHVYGHPATLSKGIRVFSEFAEEELLLTDINIVEGAGISRKNRISALDMLIILRHFSTHRHILEGTGKILYKTGTLKKIRTRAGYIEGPHKNPYLFVVFLDQDTLDADSLIRGIERTLAALEP